MPEDASSGSEELGAGAEIKTFLIADVRGYTLFTSERGDEDAAKLAAKFAAIVREEVEGRGGELIELRGDEALTAFSSARQAIRTALELQTRFVEETIADARFPLPVGIGIDAGEAVPVEGGYRGGALNLAARLCGHAGPGETLASQEAVHLARKIEGVRYKDLGAMNFKNVPDPVNVVRVLLEEGDPGDRLVAALPPKPEAKKAPSRKRRTLVLALAVIIVLIAASTPIVAHLRAAAPLLTGNGVQILDEGSGKSVGSVALPATPTGIATGDGFVWVSEGSTGNVVQIDPSEKRVVETIHDVGQEPAGIVFSADAVWVALSGEGKVARIDPSTARIEKVDVGNGPTGVATSAAGVWVTNLIDDSVTLIDPATEKVTHTWTVGSAPVAISADAQGAWVANQADGTVSRILTSGGASSPISIGGGPAGIATAPSGVWVSASLAGTLARIDPSSGQSNQSLQVGQTPSGVTADAGNVWVAVQGGSSIARVDAASGAIDHFALGASPVASSVAGKDLWVIVSASASAHKGGTLNVEIPGAPDSLDPAVAYTYTAWVPLSMTNDGLVAFDRVGGPQGTVLVPDLATSLPTPSDGGKTYSFQLRQGLGYSNGATVRPEDIRRAIERLFDNWDDPTAPPESYYAEIVGARACAADKAAMPVHKRQLAHCHLDSGIVADDEARTVTFHLSSPDPEFLYQLALPWAFAVPQDTPDRLPKNTFIPATGPYKVASYTPAPGGSERSSMVLVRNKKFVEWSHAAQPDGYADIIKITTGSTPQAQVSSVVSGTTDVIGSQPPQTVPTPDQLSSLQTHYPSLVHVSGNVSVRAFALNTKLAPFNDLRVRQALNYAVDRAELVRLFGGAGLYAPACNIIPSDYPGYRPYCPYSAPGVEAASPGADMKKAQELVNASGTRNEMITIWGNVATAPVLPYIRKVLGALGYRTRVHFVAYPVYYDALYPASARVQMSWFGWSADYPAASQFVTFMYACDGGNNLSFFCEPRVEAAIRKAQALQTIDAPAANDAWARAAGLVMDAAPSLTMPSPRLVYVVSSRTGNVEINPQYGILYDQLWVH
jgi:YVTN family beta-propeller protein